ncbi:MAG: alpha/beta hydrolase [Kineosporiaceae bacterium]
MSDNVEIDGGGSITVHRPVDEPVGTPSTATPVRPPAGPVRRLGFLRYTLPGSWTALIFACLSFTPSLLPRSGIIQGLVCGITAAIGYGLGVWGASIWRAFADRDPRPQRPWAWRAFLLGGGLLLVVFFALGQYWQHEIRALMGVTSVNVVLVVLSPLVAAVVFVLLVQLGRGLRALYRWLARQLRRWIGPRAANAVGWIVVAAVTYFVVSGVLLDGIVNAANETFSLRDTTTAEGVHPPSTELRSGGPGSLIPWDTLGWQGRTFTGVGPSASDIETLTQRPAKEPIRAYAGLASADDSAASADLAVRELEHAGGFQRKNLLVVTTTGSGWVNAASADTFEYLSGGDSAIVAMQYSYLPSWLSYLVDQSKAREAGRDLFDAVYDRWSKLPHDARPRLFVGGESLGSFGAETAFSGEYDLRNRTSGAVFAGPPNFNTLFTDFREHRDPGTPEIQPVYKDGGTVRFTNDALTSIPPQGQPWNGSRVLYLMHASDPIVWWSPRLVLNRPDWINESGRDVLQGMFWMPFVTFWQVTADLTFAGGVPDGHGHAYKAEYVDAWNAVLQPQGATPDLLTTLRSMVTAYK